MTHTDSTPTAQHRLGTIYLHFDIRTSNFVWRTATGARVSRYFLTKEDALRYCP